jgi:hypothetical protein
MKTKIILLTYFILKLLIIGGSISLIDCSPKQYDFTRINQIDSLCDHFIDTMIVYQTRTDSLGQVRYSDCQFFMTGLRENRHFLLTHPELLEIRDNKYKN